METLERTTRRLPVGAEVREGGTHIRVWAPGHERVEVILVPDGASGGRSGETMAEIEGATTIALEPELERERETDAPGYWSALVPGAGPGTRYWYRVDGGRNVPDPASRFQPDGPHGPSEVIDPEAFTWTDGDWRGPDVTGRAIYELHVGTYTAEGTLDAARRHLADLADLGIGVIELMPLGDFPGQFGWGYDGVDLFAPTRLYGRPDDLRQFVDDAHRHGIGVIVDVVYNHVGPDGCYLGEFSETWFSKRHASDWGDTFNFDDTGSDGPREFVLANARYWIDEFHVDGLRLDATQQIFDSSADNIIAAIAREVRAAAGEQRRTWIVAENEPQETRLVRDTAVGGSGLDALWNDDVHHAAVVALTGRNEAYYTDYRGAPQEFVSAARFGFLYQGQRYTWQKERRGTPAFDIRPSAFVAYLENHDQVANSARGDRLAHVASPGRLRAMTAYLLLAPATPMLFMGQEWAASSPFLYFADHEVDLARQVFDGRRDFLTQFPSIAVPSTLAAIHDPGDRRTFDACRLDHDERLDAAHRPWLDLHRDLLTLRRSTLAFTSRERGVVEGAVLGPDAFVLRLFPYADRRGASAEERLLIVNLGSRVELRPAPEPLLAPPVGSHWRLEFTTEDVRYGGAGTPDPESDEGWVLPAEAAVVLSPLPRGVDERARAR